jgi:DNA polymerase-3 subunit alpha
MPVTQFDMKDVETSGLVKFDFLGLKTLSVLRKALDLLERRSILVDLLGLPLDDPAVFELLKSGNTVGVFQLESEGMRRTLTAVKPTKFEDIIALVSLYRPGPMDNIPLFGRRKAGEVPIEYPHAKLETILAETYGIFVYQEQVMQAAQILAGYSLGEADLLRRAMGKKIQAEMDAQRQRFVDGCKEVSQIDKAEANGLFDLIDKFAGYGFNKSHAAAYALLAYQTAWLKAHYSEEFYAASMCFDMHQSEKLAVFVDDARRGGIALAGPDINRSEAEFTVEETEVGFAVRYALAGIRNVGEKAMEAIVAERERRGPFANLQDLCERMPKGALNARQLEGLICAGALDSLEPDRALLLRNADLLLAIADAALRERESGQVGLFGGEERAAEPLRLQPAEPWTRAERMNRERENFGFFFSAHPVEAFRTIASANGARSYASLMTAGGAPSGARQNAVMAAMVEAVKRGRTKRGAEFVRCDLSDGSGQFSAACFEESLVEPLTKWATDGTCLLINVELDSPSPDEPPRVTIRGARPLSEITGSVPMILTLSVTDEAGLRALAEELPRGPEGKGEVVVSLHLAGGKKADLRLGRDFMLEGAVAERLSGVAGLSDVQLSVRRGAGRLRLVA